MSLIPGDSIDGTKIIPITRLTREGWIRYQWHDVTTIGDGKRQLLRGHFRTPDEAYEARRQWDELGSDYCLPDIDL